MSITLSRRDLILSAAAAGLPGAAAAQTAPDWQRLPRGPQSPEGRPDYPFYGHYLVAFWRRAAPSTVLPDDNASQRAPGRIVRALPSFDARGRSGVPAAQQAVLMKRCEVIRDRMLAQPSLSDIHGASLDFVPRARLSTSGPNAGRLVCELAMNHRAVRLDFPETIEVDGRFHTPTPGEQLVFRVNDTANLEERLVETFRFGPNRLYSARMRHGAFWIDPALEPLAPLPPYVSDVNNLEHVPHGGDPMAIHLFTAASASNASQSSMERGQLRPTHWAGRAMAALYMVDWPAVVAELKTIR